MSGPYTLEPAYGGGPGGDWLSGPGIKRSHICGSSNEGTVQQMNLAYREGHTAALAAREAEIERLRARVRELEAWEKQP